VAYTLPAIELVTANPLVPGIHIFSPRGLTVEPVLDSRPYALPEIRMNPVSGHHVPVAPFVEERECGLLSIDPV
jgi:hypothetical protein